MRKKIIRAAAFAAALSLAACQGEKGPAGSAGTTGATGTAGATGAAAPLGAVTAISFAPMPLPTLLADVTRPTSTGTAFVTYANGETLPYTVAYETLYRTGDAIGGTQVAALLDKDGAPIQMNGGARLSRFPDAASFFVRGEKLFHLQQFEQTPAAIYSTEVTVAADGSLTPVATRSVDFSPVGGLVIACAGAKTPWDTHLAPEEDYYFDAAHFDPAAAGVKTFMAQHVDYCTRDGAGKLTGGYTAPAFAPNANQAYWCKAHVKPLVEDYLKDAVTTPTTFNPYNYGYVTEIALDATGAPSIVGGRKHYVMGKSSPELAVVMPDRKTVYLTDDGGYRGIYMFVADVPADLSAGTLYMLRWNQLSADGANGGSAALGWVKLGHSTDARLKAYVDLKPTFGDFWTATDAQGNPASCVAPAKFVKAGAPAEGGVTMCLTLRTGADRSPLFATDADVLEAAAFLEARRYGATLGATSEFTKGEGLTYDPDHKKLYVVISRVDAEGMTTEAALGNTYDHVRLAANRCGVIYEMSLGTGGAFDTANKPIESDFVGTHMAALLTGKLMQSGTAAYAAYGSQNRCHPDHISAPDNIRYWDGTLYIGEDTGDHLNDAAWAYDVASGELTRIGASVAGAEWTGNFERYVAGAEADAKTIYLFANNQHPWAESNVGISRNPTSFGAGLDDVWTDADLTANAAKWYTDLLQPLGATANPLTADDYRAHVGYFVLRPAQ